MSHYTYLLVDILNFKMYIGKRSCTSTATQDTLYMGSSKHVPKEDCIKFVLKEFKTSKEAVNHEITLHDKYDVGVNPLFYNRAKQTSVKFDTTGISMPHSEETKVKMSKAKKGVIPNWSIEGKKVMLKNMEKGRTPEVRAKAARNLKANGSNKGTKNANFLPWFITTETQTYIFTDITKGDLSVKEGHYKKYYADLQKKFNKTGQPITTKKYGKVLNIGFIPK